MRASMAVALVACIVGCAAACTSPPSNRPNAIELEEFREIAMGVDVTIIIGGSDQASRLAAARAAMAEIRACDEALSDWHASSERSRLPRAAMVRTQVSDRLFDATERALTMAQRTEGRFDPTVSPVVALWREARRATRLPDPAAVDAAMKRVGWRHVHLDAERRELWCDRDDVTLDFGGIGKGFAAQRASACLVAAGHPMHLVAVAGDMAAGPSAPPDRGGWRVLQEDGLRSPIEVELVGEAVSTSGDLEQFIEVDGVRHSHIIDPRTGRSLVERTAACVRGPDAATCDGLATALCVAGVRDAPDVLRSFPGYRASVTTINPGGRRTWSTSPGPDGPPCAASAVTVPKGVIVPSATATPQH